MWQAFGIGPGKDINLEAANGKFSNTSYHFLLLFMMLKGLKR